MALLSEKQQEYRRNATRRWNVKTGATRSGKTYGDYLLLPKRILAGHNLQGLNVILGNTRGSLQRNIISPLQDLYGTNLVSDIHSDNTAELFGESCYC
ncbi:MAG: PBSX family phage terminase large subunit, partial [Firmicutes bacterium]|nr:PBSX family phage terminase large subunit [Bacillota bacterium]